MSFFQSENYPESVVCLAFQKVSGIHGWVCVWPALVDSSDRPILVILLFNLHNISIRGAVCQNYYVLSKGPSIGQYFVEQHFVTCKG